MEETGVMRFEHFIMYRLRGLVYDAEAPDIEILNVPDDSLNALITTRPDEHCLITDTDATIANALLSGIFRGESAPLNTVLPERIEAIRKTRKSESGNDPFLVVRRNGIVAQFILTHQRQFDNFVVSINAVNKQEIREVSKPFIDRVLTSFTLVQGSISSIEVVADSIVFFKDDGTRVHSYSFKGSANLQVSKVLSADIAQVPELYADLSQVAKLRRKDLSRAIGLAVASLQSDKNPLRSFLTAWSALEIFIQKVFPIYEQELFEKLNDSPKSDARSISIDRIKDVMKDKYRLADKFAIIATELASHDADKDLSDFQEAKKIRDGIHAEDVSAEKLPLETVRNIYNRYLSLHLRRQQ